MSTSKGVKAVIQAYTLVDVMSGGALSAALDKEINRGRKPQKPYEPCHNCTNNRKGCEEICRRAKKELYTGYEVRIKWCSEYKEASNPPLQK